MVENNDELRKKLREQMLNDIYELILKKYNTTILTVKDGVDIFLGILVGLIKDATHNDPVKNEEIYKDLINVLHFVLIDEIENNKKK